MRKLMCLHVSMVLAFANTLLADVYTWTGSASSIWNKTDNNWDKGVWVDGNEAVFPAGAEVTLGEDVTVGNSLTVSSGAVSLGGAHTLTISKSSGNAVISQTSSASLTLKDGITVSATANLENNINVLNITNATFNMSSGKLFHNGWGTPSGGATVNIGDGGTMYAPEFIISGSRSSADKDIYRVNVKTGGVLRIGHFYKEYSIAEQRHGTLYFDGGTLEGNGSQMFSYPASAVTIKVGAGGMRFGGSGNIHMYNSIASGNGADGGLTVDMTGTLLYLNWEGHAGSEHTQRTFTGPVSLNRIGTVIIDDDLNLGAEPAEPTDGLIFNTSCKLLSHGPVRLNKNRNVIIKSDVTAVIAGENGNSLAIEGTVSGSAPGATRNGTLSTESNWVGELSLLPPAGRTNSFGRLMVKKQGLTIGGEGVTEITDTLGNLDDLGDYGVFFVENAALNVTNGLVRVMTNNYSIVKDGAVNVLGGTLDFSRQKMYINAYGAAATTTVARAGTLIARRYCPSYYSSAEASLTRLQTGGTLVCDEIYMNPNTDHKGQIDFDGGVLAPQVSSQSFFSGDKSSAWFDRSPWYVREGGAVISNDVQVFTHHPFLTGAAQDGGLHKWGTAKFATITTANTFNGPVVVHQGILVWGNDNNYPATTTLVTYYGGTADINGKAQTLARVEGDGAVGNCTSLTVSGSVAPGFGADAPGRLRFNQQCVFAEGCILVFDALDTLTVAAGQDISALSLQVNDLDALDRDAVYTVLDVASGGDFVGTFRNDNIPNTSAWHVRYDHMQHKVTLGFQRGTVIVVR